ncbi:hypothetical protein KR059_004320 [Drosophila kikkawai]|nr:hypothetical protein KR059_004320 [Drosophila kikkawai]
MHSFTAFVLWVLATRILRQGSCAKGQSGYICVIEDPKQNQCDSYCLTELSPRLSEVVKAQNQGNTKLETLEVKIGDVQAKLPQEVYAKLEGRLQEVEATLGRQLQEVQTKMEGQQTKMEGILSESLAAQKKIENQLQAVVNQLQAVSNKLDAANVEVPALSTITIPSGFELLGNRYFRILYEEVDWQTAEKRCREMGGYLASFRNEKEIHAIKPNLTKWHYWLGINDRENEGHFVSVASQKPASFFKWGWGHLSDENHEQNCVSLYYDIMFIQYCNKAFYFICQADNET